MTILVAAVPPRERDTREQIICALFTIILLSPRPLENPSLLQMITGFSFYYAMEFRIRIFAWVRLLIPAGSPTRASVVPLGSRGKERERHGKRRITQYPDEPQADATRRQFGTCDDRADDDGRTGSGCGSDAAHRGSGKPNIVVIWGDDVGISNLSCYSMGVMGYRTPNIDRIAREGMLFTDYYGEQSCTAGRSAFITGQSVFRTGLSKVGVPGATVGLNAADPTIAGMLKPLGYATGQFGKNHLGDRNEFLPTVHGFDEFYGNLYHLNAEEDPEQADYPKPADFPNFAKSFGPRGVIHSFATDVDDGKDQPRWGRVGKQKIEDTGPLTRTRMETIDDDIAARSADFIERMNQAGRPFFMWVNFTHMHLRTHAKPSSVGQSGRWQDIYHDVMIDHDKNVGTVLAKLDELHLADNTIVIYGTDNGPHANSWPDGATTPYRSEKNTNWEGAYRVPFMVRWPGKIQAGSVSNEIVSHHDWLPTLVAAAGMPDINERLLAGYKVGDQTFKVHIDGYNILPYLTGQQPKTPRPGFIYFSDDGDLTAIRFDNWKMVFAQQRSPGTLAVWSEPFVHTRIPWLYNLRTDPYERADTDSNTYWDWYLDHAYLIMAAQTLVQEFLATFKDFPPRQKAASFTIDQILQRMSESISRD